MIDPQLIKYLSDEQASTLRVVEKFFDSEGWNLFVEQTETAREQCQNDELHAPTWEYVMLQRGKRTVYDDILNLPAATVNEFEQLALTVKDNLEATDETIELDYE